MNGFINVLKPVGATASDVVVRIKHILHEKAGHLGTLDPGASGVLPVAMGLGTRLFNLLTDKVKYYRAFFTFGKTTDTLDSYGTVTEKRDLLPSEETLRKVLRAFEGQLQQLPPAYSAISVGGVRSYKLARQGEAVQLSARCVTVYEIGLVSQVKKDTFVVDIKCSAGTYIRSLARDVAEACGTVGYMSGLIRLASGCFDISEAYTLDEISEKREKCLLELTYPLYDLSELSVNDKFYEDLQHGRPVFVEKFDGLRKVFCKGTFWGVGSAANGKLKLDYYLKNAD